VQLKWSLTGKSGAAFEAVAKRLPHWQVLYPRRRAPLTRLLEEGIAGEAVLWLNDLRHYADDPGRAELLFELADLLQARTTSW
jgi:hypothetical protein